MPRLAPSLLLLALLPLASPVIFRLTFKGEERCFLIRSQFSRASVNFSYVVFSEVFGGNNIGFLLTNESSKMIISRVEPDATSHQRIFKFESDGSTNYRGCFTSPNDYPKSIRLYVEHVKREDFVSKDNIYGSLRLLNDLKDEETKLEEELFVEYMNLKYIEETLTKSQKVLTAAFVLKFSLFLVAAVLQFWGISKLLSRLSVSVTELV